MVEVEIRTPFYDEEAREIQWRSLALVRAEGQSIEIYGDETCVPRERVISVFSGRQIDPADQPEEWARNLPSAYRAGDLVAVILHDDDPPEVATLPGTSEDEPSIPEAHDVDVQEPHPAGIG